MNRPRLIVSDLDGTLLGANHSGLSEFTLATLAQAAEAGVPVLFATGRPTRHLDVIAAAPTCMPLALVANGALLYDLTKPAVVWSQPIDPVATLALVEALRSEVPGAAFAVEFPERFGREPEYGDLHHLDLPNTLVAPMEELVIAEPFVKLIVLQREWEPERLAAVAATFPDDRLNITFSSSFGLLEISAGGVSKGTALARLAAELGVAAEDVVAFGDMPNDLDMLRWAGRGYAMANAHAHVQAAGLPTIGYHHEDGVALKILELLQLPGHPAHAPLDLAALAREELPLP